MVKVNDLMSSKSPKLLIKLLIKISGLSIFIIKIIGNCTTNHDERVDVIMYHLCSHYYLYVIMYYFSINYYICNVDTF